MHALSAEDEARMLLPRVVITVTGPEPNKLSYDVGVQGYNLPHGDPTAQDVIHAASRAIVSVTNIFQMDYDNMKNVIEELKEKGVVKIEE